MGTGASGESWYPLLPSPAGLELTSGVVVGHAPALDAHPDQSRQLPGMWVPALASDQSPLPWSCISGLIPVPIAPPPLSCCPCCAHSPCPITSMSHSQLLCDLCPSSLLLFPCSLSQTSQLQPHMSPSPVPCPLQLHQPPVPTPLCVPIPLPVTSSCPSYPTPIPSCPLPSSSDTPISPAQTSSCPHSSSSNTRLSPSHVPDVPVPSRVPAWHPRVPHSTHSDTPHIPVPTLSPSPRL